MFDCFATLNCDTEFRVPPDCLREGEVSCRVVRAECDVVDVWDHWVTIKVRLLLKITIRSGELVCRFFKEIILKESVWLEPGTWIKDCDVVAAACRCVLHRGRLHCNLTVKVEFRLKKKWHDPCCWDRCDDWSGACDWEEDWVWTRRERREQKVQVCRPKLVHCRPDPCRRFHA
ncbi:MAG: hypothetical protein ACOY93_15080 [Bacillota bacterium]